MAHKDGLKGLLDPINRALISEPSLDHRSEIARRDLCFIEKVNFTRQIERHNCPGMAAGPRTTTDASSGERRGPEGPTGAYFDLATMPAT